MNKLVYPVPLSKEYMEDVRIWRNQIMETTRTPYFLTKEQQEDYYINTICDRKSNTRYWAFVDHEELLCGMGGIENIIWESRIGEISLIVKPSLRGNGYGKAIVDYILEMAFKQLNLATVWGECYECGAVEFWKKIIFNKQGTSTVLPRRKYFSGKYWDSLYFTFINKCYEYNKNESCGCEMK